MQNRYTGDIGDYGKLGLLRILSSAGLTIGINWYLTPDEKHNEDGLHVKYLYEEEIRSCDDELWRELRSIVDSGNRKVSVLEEKRIIRAKYYSKVLDFSGMSKSQRIEYRKKWHREACSVLSGVDVVFVDPDNGIVVPSAEGRAKENKFVKPSELADYYAQGSSVIYYQHKARRKDDFYTEQHKALIHSSGFDDSTGLVLKFRTTSQRYYLFILQNRHKGIIEGAIRGMLSSPWRDHFCLL